MLDTIVCYCDKCGTTVEVTPTNTNRMVYVECKGREHRPHPAAKMRHLGLRVYRPELFASWPTP